MDQSLKNKSYFIEFYNLDGTEIQENISRDIWFNEVQFGERVNGGQGELSIRMKMDLKTLENEPWADFSKFIKVYVQDKDYTSGRHIYTGYITEINPIISAATEIVEIKTQGLGTLLSRSLYSGTIVRNFTNEDPADIAKAIIDDFLGDYPVANGNTGAPNGWVYYTGSSVQNVGTNVDISFDSLTWAQAINQCVELAGGNYFWFVDKDGIFQFKTKDSNYSHTFRFREDVQEFRGRKTNERMQNKISLVVGNGTATSENLASQTQYGLRHVLATDNRIASVTVGQRKADALVAERGNPVINSTIVVNNRYDIESINAGDRATLINIDLNSSFFEDNMFIESVRYSKDQATITISEGYDFADEIEVLARKTADEQIDTN